MSAPAVAKRPLGKTTKQVTPVALGCWPMSGVSTLGATHADGVATVHAAIDAGINHLDTAYAYGAKGESDAILCEALADRRDEVVLASKIGLRCVFDDSGSYSFQHVGRPELVLEDCDTLLKRLGVEQIDLLYLHSPDPEVPVAESAGALAELIELGKIAAAGASNCSLEEIQSFAAACPLSAVQLPYNMLQRDIESETLPWCQAEGVSVMVYWALMKGLLAGKLPRDHQFEQGDSRAKYPMYQGEEWQKNQDFVDRLRAIAEEAELTVAQLVTRWTLEQPGITSVLCGAKRDWQIAETVVAQHAPLGDAARQAIAEAIEQRGHAEAKRLFR